MTIENVSTPPPSAINILNQLFSEFQEGRMSPRLSYWVLTTVKSCRIEEGHEEEFAQLAAQCLEKAIVLDEKDWQERSRDPRHRRKLKPLEECDYAERGDLIEALALICHPATQRVIALSIADPSIPIQERVTRILSDPERRIYSETLIELSDRGKKGQALALSILEKNPTAGHEDGRVLSTTEDILTRLLNLDTAEEQDFINQRRAALVTSLLYKRTNGGLTEGFKNRACEVLRDCIGRTVAELSTKSHFTIMLNEIVDRNYPLAIDLLLENISILPLDLPFAETQKEIAALARLAPDTFQETEQCQDFQGLSALLVVKARQKLIARINEEQSREQMERERRAKEMEADALEQKRLADEACRKFPQLIG